MPTGYTNKVQTGEMTKLEDFIMQFIRDKEFKEVSTYHLDKLNESQEEYCKFNKLSDDEIKKEIDEYYDMENECRRKYNKRTSNEKQNYLDMIDKLNKWHPGDEYMELKTYGLKQLEESIEWDCISIYTKELEKPSIKEYKENVNKGLLWDIEYHSRKYSEEVARVKKHNEYLRGLFEEFKQFEEKLNG